VNIVFKIFQPTNHLILFQIDFSKGFVAAKQPDQISVQTSTFGFKLKKDPIHQLAKVVSPGWKFLKGFVIYIDKYCAELSRKK